MGRRSEALEIAQAERLLSEFFKRSAVGLAIFDESLCYRMINPYLASAHQISIECHLGRHIREILGNVGVQVEPAIRRVFSTSQPILNYEVAGALPSRPKGGHWIDTFFPIADSDGKVKQVGAVVVELDKNVQLQEIASGSSNPETVLRSWKDIAHYMGTCVKTVQRWERAYEFPVRRVQPNKGSIVFAFQNEVDDWLHGRNLHVKVPLRVPPRKFPLL